jgi:hypothetical protein
MSLPDVQQPSETEHQFHRRMAVKYGLDFEHRCKFQDQMQAMIETRLHNSYAPQLVEVMMTSGRTAVFLLTSTDHHYSGTGQRDWHFEFQRYKA